jgi:hypothetical protein
MAKNMQNFTDNTANLLLNSGFYAANFGQPVHQKTIIVWGAPRGGTSMVAGVLANLGVFMGNRMGAAHEDKDIKDIIQKMVPEEQFDEIVKIIQSRNNIHDIWGFKQPKLLKRISEIDQSTRNPLHIFVFRDLLSIAMRNEISAKQELFVAFKNAMKYYNMITMFMESTKSPFIAISYEKALLNPGELIDFFVTRIGLTPSNAQLLSAKNFVHPSPEDYLIQSQVK